MLLVLLSASLSVAATCSNLLAPQQKLLVSIASSVIIIFQLLYHLLAFCKRRRFSSKSSSLGGPSYRYQVGTRTAKEGEHVLQQYRDWTKQHGDMYLLWRGLQPCVVVSAGKTVDAVLNKHVKQFSQGLDLSFMRHFLGNGLLTQRFWERNKPVNLQSTGISGRRSDILLRTTKQFVDATIADLDRKLQNAVKMELNIYVLVSHVMLRTLFTEHFARPLSKGETNYLHMNLEDAKISSETQKESLEKLVLFLHETLSDKNVVEKAVDEQRTLGQWLGSRMTDEEVVDQMLLMMLICHELPASLMSSVMQYVCLHTDIQDSIRFEIRDVHAQRVDESECVIFTEEVECLHYTEAVLKETLRMATPLPVIGRKSTNRTTLEGVHIPKGVPVLAALHAMHTNQKIWQDADIFVPERHLCQGGGDSTGADYEAPKMNSPGFQPFGAGPLQCPYAKNSLDQMKLMLATLVHKYKLSMIEKEIPKLELCGLSVRPTRVSIILERRGKLF